MSGIKIGIRLLDLAEETLRFYRQSGAEAVEMPSRYSEQATNRSPAPLLPSAQTNPPRESDAGWDASELLTIRERIERFDLSPLMMNLPIPRSILLGRESRDKDLDTVCANIAAAGRARIGTLRYAFRAMRPNGGYVVQLGAGRGGADLRAFDFDRVRQDPPLEGVGVHTREQMWERLMYFLERTVPVAAASGVRLALHPNDPPPAAYRGVAQPVHTVADMKRVIAAIDSPFNTVVGHPGVFTEMGENAVETLRFFGERSRIGAVHFRNVRSEVPYERYVETFIDEGDSDMPACMRVLQESGFEGMVDPDHVPGMVGDSEDQRTSWAFALGATRAMRSYAEAIPRSNRT